MERIIKVEIDMTDEQVETFLDTLLEMGATSISVATDNRMHLVQGVPK